MKIKTLLLSLLLITPAYADLDKAVELAEQGKVKEGRLELIKIVKAADAGDPKSQMEFDFEVFSNWDDASEYAQDKPGKSSIERLDKGRGFSVKEKK